MKRWAPWLALAGAVVLVGVLSARADDTGEPLDPRSSGPLGARALVLLLEQMGADVTIGPTAPDSAGSEQHRVAVLLVDDLGRAQQRTLRAWVEQGGTLVVTDPLSDFVPALAQSGGTIFNQEEQADALRPGCSLPAVQPVDRIEVPAAAMYRVRGEPAVGCFFAAQQPTDGPRRAYLVARALGRGTVVALGGGAPFINDRLDQADNAVLAVALMAPVRGSAVTVLEPDVPGSGDESLFALMPGGVRRALWQLGAAFLALGLWAGRRLARPIEETQPVDIPGSELVVATGNLLHHAGRRDAAAGMLRYQLRREVAARYGTSADAPADDVVAVLQARGVDADVARAALLPNPITGDDALVALAASIQSLRREVTHV